MLDLGLSPFTDQMESKLQKEAIQIATRQAEQLAIFDELVDYLQHLNAVIPPLYRFQKIVSHAAVPVYDQDNYRKTPLIWDRAFGFYEASQFQEPFF